MKKKEFIGEHAVVEYNGQRVDGVIIDETKNMLVLESDSGTRKIIKKSSIIHFKNSTVLGSEITRRPEDRIKK